jgi:hypothetical protein
MATYIPGMTDYIPQIQPFKPDYNFYGNILQTKQGQFDANHKQISGVYSTLLNSPMTRDSNLARREEFFKAIDQDIKKISGMDLSKQENVTAANKIFSSFYNDKNMVNDMVKTKNWMSEMDRGENFRKCTSSEECGGEFWEAGLQALQYKREDFRKASDEQAMGMDMGRYVPYQNFTDKAFKAAKEAGFNIKTDTVNGGYIVTTKNGQQLTPQLHDYFMAKFGDDPKMMDVFKTQAFVQRKNYIAQAAALTGNEEAAENDYINSIINTVPQANKAAQTKANDTHDSIANRLKVMQVRAQEEGADENAVKSFQDLQEQFGIAQANKGVHDKAETVIKTAQNIKDPIAYKDRIDDIVAYAMLQHHSATTAENYAMKDTELSVKADPYGLATHSSNLSLRNMMAGKEADFNYWTKKEDYKQAVEVKKKAEEQDKLNRMFGLSDKPVMDPNTPGGATEQKSNTEVSNTTDRNNLIIEKTSAQKSFVTSMIGSMKAAYDAAGQADVEGGSEKQKLIIDTAKKVFEGTGVDPAKLFKDDTYSEEYAKIGNLSLGTTKVIYDKSLVNVNPNAKGIGAENSFWSRDFWNDKGGMTETIKVREKLIGAFDKQYQSNAANVKADLIGNYQSEGSREKILMANSLTDAKGRFLTKEEFAKEYARKNQGSYPEEGTNNSANGMQAASTYSGAQGQTNIRTPFQKAYSAALLNYDNLSKDYTSAYQAKGVASNGLNILGNQGGAKTAAGYWYQFEPAVLEHNGTLNGYSFFRNYDQLKASEGVNLNVKFGDADIITHNDDAKKVLDLLEQDSKRQYKLTDDKRPSLSYRAQEVAGGDANMTAVHFQIPEKWASQYTKKGGALEGIDKDLLNKGLTLFIPKDKATNQYHTDNQMDDYDRLLKIDGQINMDTYPDAGKVNLKVVGDKYIISGFFNDLTPEGKPVPTTYYEEHPLSTGLKPGMIVDNVNSKMKQHSIELQNYKRTYNAKHGIKTL